MQITKVAALAGALTRIARNDRLVQNVALRALDAKLMFTYCSNRVQPRPPADLTTE